MSRLDRLWERRLGDDFAERKAAEMELSQIVMRPLRRTKGRSCTWVGVRLGTPEPDIPLSE